MRKKKVEKAIVFVAIVLFIGISFLPSITGNINKSLTDQFTITISKPENAIYRNNQKLAPFFVPLILRGSIGVEIELSPTDVVIDRIELWVDHAIYDIIMGPGPFNGNIFTFKGKAFSKIEIMVIAYAANNLSPESDEITIWRVFL